MPDLIDKSSVKRALEGNQVSADFYEALDDRIEALLEEAAQRAEANGRMTVHSRDLQV